MYFVYGTLINFATLGLVNGLAGALGGCCAAPRGADVVIGQWKLFLLGTLFLVAFVTSLSVGVGAFTGVSWLKKGMRTAGSLGVACCLLSLCFWGFGGLAKYLFLGASLYILLSAPQCKAAQAVASPPTEMA
jgi:hypothetical protein